MTPSGSPYRLDGRVTVQEPVRFLRLIPMLRLPGFQPNPLGWIVDADYVGMSGTIYTVCASGYGHITRESAIAAARAFIDREP